MGPTAETPEAIKARRVYYGLSQSAAAALVGVTVAQWSHYETGRSAMPISRWEQFNRKAKGREVSGHGRKPAN